jgi:hypothetical protein
MGPENTIHMHTWALKLGCDVLEMGTSWSRNPGLPLICLCLCDDLNRVILDTKCIYHVFKA